MRFIVEAMMQATNHDRHPARKSRFWARPIERLARRKVAPGHVTDLSHVAPALAVAPDEGDELLRRLREAGL